MSASARRDARRRNPNQAHRVGDWADRPRGPIDWFVTITWVALLAFCALFWAAVIYLLIWLLGGS